MESTTATHNPARPVRLGSFPTAVTTTSVSVPIQQAAVMTAIRTKTAAATASIRWSLRIGHRGNVTTTATAVSIAATEWEPSRATHATASIATLATRLTI